MVAMEDVHSSAGHRIPSLLTYLVRLRVQFVTTVVLAVLLPVTLRWGINFEMWLKSEQVTTLIAAPVAILIGLIGVRQISNVPGARETYYLAPVMAVSFSIVLAVMLLIRVDYNRYLFPTALAISIVWIFLTYALSERVRRSRFAVVPGGAAEALTRLPAAEWVLMTTPALPSGRLDGVAVDLRGELDDQWERFIADCALSGVRVFHEAQLRESLSGRVEITHLSENPLGSINPNAGYIGPRRRASSTPSGRATRISSASGSRTHASRSPASIRIAARTGCSVPRTTSRSRPP